MRPSASATRCWSLKAAPSSCRSSRSHRGHCRHFLSARTRAHLPYVEAAAIPCVAVPLLQDDCIDTTVDIDWPWDYIHLTRTDRTRRLNLNALHDEVENVAQRGLPHRSHGCCRRPGGSRRPRLPGCAGKRWRPFLTVATSRAPWKTPRPPSLIPSKNSPSPSSVSTKPHSFTTTSKTATLTVMVSRHRTKSTAFPWR